MGGGGKKGGGDSNPAADAQARISQQLFQQTDPLRMGLIGRSQSFLGITPQQAGSVAPGGGPAQLQASAGGKPGFAEALPRGGGIDGLTNKTGAQPSAAPLATSGFGDVTATPTYAAFRDQANRQFAGARDNAIARLAPGGALAESLVGLEGNRASALTQGAANIYEQELARAMTLATGQTGTALGGLGQAALAQGQMAQAQSAQNAGKASALGTAAGGYFGGKA
jgi:hypothetical protein